MYCDQLSEHYHFSHCLVTYKVLLWSLQFHRYVLAGTGPDAKSLESLDPRYVHVKLLTVF